MFEVSDVQEVKVSTCGSIATCSMEEPQQGETLIDQKVLQGKEDLQGMGPEIDSLQKLQLEGYHTHPGCGADSDQGAGNMACWNIRTNHRKPCRSRPNSIHHEAKDVTFGFPAQRRSAFATRWVCSD